MPSLSIAQGGHFSYRFLGHRLASYAMTKHGLVAP